MKNGYNLILRLYEIDHIRINIFNIFILLCLAQLIGGFMALLVFVMYHPSADPMYI